MRVRRFIRHERGTEATITLAGDDTALVARGCGEIEVYAPTVEDRVPDSVALISMLGIHAAEIGENLFLSAIRTLMKAEGQDG